MTLIKWSFILLVLGAVTGLLAGRLGLLKGMAPTDLGVRDGRLKPPSDKPNSVSSQTVLYPDHPQHAYADIPPLQLKGNPAATLDRIAEIIESMEGGSIIERKTDYIYAQFTSRLMKYVDDSEFWFDPAARVIQVRSASRLGHSDMGVNRKRIELIRRELENS